MKDTTERWVTELEDVASKDDHVRTLGMIRQSFLESDHANDKLERIRVCWLLSHIEKIVV